MYVYIRMWMREREIIFNKMPGVFIPIDRNHFLEVQKVIYTNSFNLVDEKSLILYITKFPIS